MIIQSTSLKGNRYSNEDAEIIFQNLNKKNKKFKNINLYAVFDGHGGDSVSKYLEKNFLNYFIPSNSVSPTVKKGVYQKHIYTCYKHIQKKLKNEYKDMAHHTGTAALSIIHYQVRNRNKLYVINLGDCRAVLCNRFNIAIPLTKDHKPTNYEETLRIHKLGGKITQDPGDDPRIEGLSLSRALGDFDAEKYVSHIPEIFRYDLDKRDKFIILACDGLWDVFQNQQAVDFVLKHLLTMKKLKTTKNITNNIAYLLAKEAINRGSQDNVSVIIVLFN